jgi:hypothetical protein
MKRKCIFGLAILIMLLSGCAVIGKGKDFRPLEEKALVQVNPGTTTASDITKMFGAPNQIIKLSNGNAYIYYRSQSKALGIWLVLVTMVNYDTQYDRIVFFFNRNDILTHYGSSFQSEKAAYGTPF